MREGSPGDACYVIVAGEVRVEVERPDFDSNGVVSFMGPGAVCGELGLLDGSPRSASVYAHTDVTARRLTAGALRELCDRDPQAGVMMLRWLARSAAEKARAFSKDLEEFIFTDEPDPVVDELIARSDAARQSIADWPEVRVDALITDLAAQLAGHADELAAATVTETGIGCVADKVEKNLFGSLGVAKSLVGKPGVGVIGERESLAEIADPMGVVLGLIPVTNPGLHAGFQDPDLHKSAKRSHSELPPARGEGRGAHPGPAPSGPGSPRCVGRSRAERAAAPHPADHRGPDAPPGCVNDPGHRRDRDGQGGVQLGHPRDRRRAG
jgi:acetaldehyde dehydrogenase/alcohol dehydrogenase